MNTTHGQSNGYRTKRIFRIAVLAFSFHARSVLGQSDDLQSLVHEKVTHHAYGFTKGERWEDGKKAFAAYSDEQLVHALITETAANPDPPTEGRSRDASVLRFLEALNVPRTLVWQTLDKETVPRRKVALMTMLRRDKSPEVTQALLRQLKDHRPALEPRGETEIVKMRALRVCDVAMNVLVDNLGDGRATGIGMYLSDARRDEIIREMLGSLSLTPPE